MPVRLEDIKWNFEPGGVTYLTKDQWNLVMEKAMKMVLCGACGEIHELGGPCLTNTPRVGEARRDPLLIEREKTHGSFETTASIAQELKGIFKRHGVAKGMQYPFTVQIEALDMIATKLARILSGNPHEKDHWLDLAGYAKLGAEACDE